MSEPVPLRDKVRNWLDTQGYPLEMRAASIFRAAGFRVVQSDTYVDRETGKVREIDLVCSHDERTGLASTKIVVECKSGEKPWIIFSSPHVLEGRNRFFAYADLSPDLRGALLKCEYELVRQRLSWLEKRDLIGYSVVQAFKQNEDQAYGVAQALLKAATAQRPKGRDNPQLTAIFPVLVIDSPLFECYLDDEGRIQLNEVSELEFLPNSDSPCVRIVTFPVLSRFSEAAWTETDSLLELLKPTIADALDRLANPTRRRFR